MMRADRPRISRMLLILLPMIFPSIRSVCPSIPAWILTASSGALVPNATTVSAMISLGMLKYSATRDAPRTIKSAPVISATRPTMNQIICSITYSWLSVYFAKNIYRQPTCLQPTYPCSGIAKS